MSHFRPEKVLLRFQLHSGARVASRTLAPLAVGFTAAAVIAGSPLIVLSPIAFLLFPPEAGVASALYATCVLGITAAGLAPRLKPGLTGWIRHLPTTSLSHRRAAAGGLAVATLPVLAVVIAAGLTMLPGCPLPTACRLLGIPVLALAAAHAALPVGGLSRILALLSAAFSFSGSPWFLLAAVAALVAADQTARDDTLRSSGDRGPVRPGIFRGSLFWVTITIRSLGFRIPLTCLTSVLILIPLLFFVNNNGLTTAQSHIAVRFAGLMAALFIMAAVADGLARRRPPWPWVRSLPWSAGRRVGLDAVILAAAALPALLAAGLIRPMTLPSLLIVVPLLSLRSAAAVRTAPSRASGAAGQLVAEGFLVAAATAVLPVLSVLAIPAFPLAFRAAIHDEKSQDVSRWHELHHLAAGDSASWSAP